MTIDEAINREEALAYSFGERYKRLGEPVGDLPELEAEHKQYADWLRELKALKQNMERQIKGAEEEIEDEYKKTPLDIEKIRTIQIYKECLKDVLYNER